MYIGWDWAAEAHDITVMDDAGAAVDRWAPDHDEAGMETTLRRLATHGDPAELAVAIEANASLVIDRLLAAGHPVVPIHPNAFPSPESARLLGEARMAMFCKRHFYSGRRSPAELLERLRTAPVSVHALSAEVVAELVRAQARLLRALLGTVADLDRAISAALLATPKRRCWPPFPASERSTWPRSSPRSGPSWTGRSMLATPAPRPVPPR